MKDAQNDWIDNPFLNSYLRYVKNTESPEIMHIWSAITCAAAAMGRHVWLPFGIGNIYPNMFTLLVGPPGTRKSQAIKYCSKLLAKNTSVRFAPDDTGGARQGLISALERDTEDDDADLKSLEVADKLASISDLESLEVKINGTDVNTLFAAASEFGTFMGEGNSTMTRLLNKLWDGEDYHYKLKNEQKTLRNPLMTIIGGTTPSDIARILPSESIGQGFMSRWILVFAPNKSRKVSRPSLDKEAKRYVEDVLSFLSYEMKGEMFESPEAAKRLDYIYENSKLKIEDSRFVYYVERRHTHLQKLTMVLAATRKDYTITVNDVEQALAILELTEESMPQALGEFGLSPIGAAKQKLLEFLQHSLDPVSQKVLWTIMQRDVKISEFKSILSDLINADKIAAVDMKDGLGYVAKTETHEINALIGDI